MQVHQCIFWYHSVAGVWLDYPPLTTCNNTPAHGTTDLKPKRFPFFLQNPVLQTGRWSWLLAPSDVATPLRLPPTSPLPLLSLLHLLLHHCECFLERVTGGGVGQSKNWSHGDWVWVILIVEPIWKWYAWCVFCAGAHGVWYSWYSTALCPLKKMVSSQFWFWDLWGTHRQQAQRNPKNTCKLSVGSHRQPHQTKMHSPVKRLDSFSTSCHKKIQHSVPNVICCQLQLFPFLSLDLWGTNRQQAQTNTKKHHAKRQCQHPAGKRSIDHGKFGWKHTT